MIFVLLVRHYLIAQKYRPQFKLWFKSEYGYELKNPLDVNYFRALFTSKTEFMRKYRRAIIINFILFVFFVAVAGILNDMS